MKFKIIALSSGVDFEKSLNHFSENNKIKKVDFFSKEKLYVAVIQFEDLNEERENKILSLYEETSPIVDYIDNMFKNSFKKQWYETYFAIDVHGTILIPDYNKSKKDNDVIFYPYAKETLQLLTKRDDIKLIMFTSSYPDEIDFYNNAFKSNNINFDYINQNPEIDSKKGNFGFYDNKFYFNILLDDKAGFRPDVDWKLIYELFKKYEITNYFPDKNWTTKY
jgi:hypothetical protein